MAYNAKRDTFDNMFCLLRTSSKSVQSNLVCCKLSYLSYLLCTRLLQEKAFKDAIQHRLKYKLTLCKQGSFTPVGAQGEGVS